jgi:hypothetical protein
MPLNKDTQLMPLALTDGIGMQDLQSGDYKAECIPPFVLSNSR